MESVAVSAPRVPPRETPLIVEFARFAFAIAVPFHTPVVIVPRVVREDCPTYKAEISITGVVPPEEVILFAVPVTDVTVPVVGVVHVGARVVPAEVRTCPAVPFAKRVPVPLAPP